MPRAIPAAVLALIVGSLAACTSAPVVQGPAQTSPSSAEQAPQGVRGEASSAVTPEGPLPDVIVQAKSRWVPVPWSALPGLDADDIAQAWPAWLQSCSRPMAAWAKICPQIMLMANAPLSAQRSWIRQNLQPYRIESPEGVAQGKLTSYFEPQFEASRLPRAGFTTALYAPPKDLRKNTPWFTRQEIESRTPAGLRGREIAYLADPIEAMVLHIQGSGLIRINEPDGSQRTVRMAFAASNEQPYKSIGSWLLQQRLLTDASWPGIKDWMTRNPSRVNELLWKNPRFIFFKEEALPAGLEPAGPKGAQGVPLTAGRSVAVDRQSIPYGTPLWLVSKGAGASLDKLVIAQDTGSAIVGAVRADYYAGSGPSAGEFAGRINQGLALWALWPR